MIIDAHAHLVAPPALYAHRSNLLAAGGHYRGAVGVGDEALAEAAASNVATMDSVGTDVQLISPRPYQQMHSAKPDRLVHWWLETNNDLIAATVALHPDRFAGVAGVPVCAGSPVTEALPEIERAVNELGFVGVQLNPDPYEGTGPSPGLGDRYWYPLYEKLVELDVPALIHSAGCNNGRESYSAHFVTEESLAILGLVRSEVFRDLPDLRIIVAHGGGSIPYQLGRWQAETLSPGLGGSPDAERFEVGLRRLWFDTVLHHPPALELLFRTVGPDRCLFGTEKPGSGSAVNPDTGRSFDDLRPVIEGLGILSADEREMVFEGNARRVFPRLAKILAT
jgi:predicted TIM-barrel fold metal-dependent hydrolase